MYIAVLGTLKVLNYLHRLREPSNRSLWLILCGMQLMLQYCPQQCRSSQQWKDSSNKQALCVIQPLAFQFPHAQGNCGDSRLQVDDHCWRSVRSMVSVLFRYTCKEWFVTRKLWVARKGKLMKKVKGAVHSRFLTVHPTEKEQVGFPHWRLLQWSCDSAAVMVGTQGAWMEQWGQHHFFLNMHLSSAMGVEPWTGHCLHLGLTQRSSSKPWRRTVPLGISL